MNAVRLEVLHQMRSFLADIAGAPDTTAFVASLPYTLKSLLAREGDADAWVESRDFSMLLAAIDLQALPQLEKFFLNFGKLFIENHAECFPAFHAHSLASLFFRSRQSAVLTLARQFQKDLETLRRWFSPLDIAVDEKISLQTLRFHLAARPAPLPAFCELMLGFATGLLEIHHVPYVRISEENCQLDGHSICSFLIELEPESPLSFL